MGEVVNLRRARKIQQRRSDEAQAEENRVRFGLSKAERQMTEKIRAQATKNLDGHLLESGDSEDSPE